MPESLFPPLPEDEVRSFLATIHEDPHDEARRLIFADWLDEHGDPRAEMIRLSIEAYHVTAENPRVKEIMDQWRAWGEYGEKMQAWLCQYANESNDIEVTTSRLGLLHATIWGNDESPPREAKEAFEAAWRQGWFESAEFRGTPNALAKKTSLRVREFVLSLPSVETYAFGDHIDDDDLVGAAEIPNLVGIFLEARDRLTDAGLAELCNHPRLESLGISGGRFTREGLIHLATIPRLRSLYMEQFFNLDDEALSRLANMKTLESVRLPSRNQFSAGGFWQLLSLPKLRDLWCKRLPEDVLKEVENHPTLESVMVGGKFTNAVLPILATLPQLSELSLGSVEGVTDDDIELLCERKELRSLRLKLTSPKVTAAAVRRLASLTNLRELELSGVKMSKKTREFLREQLPNCTVYG